MERALSAVNAEAEGKGVSTQSIDALIQAMEASGVSKEHVSRICAEIDEPVQSPIKRPLEDPFPYVWLEATYVKARNGGRVVDRAIMIAVGLTEVGRREVLGVMVGPCPTEASWLEYLRHLLDRGLRGIQLVMPNDHAGLRKAIRTRMTTEWRRCRVPFMRNPLARAPNTQKGFVKAPAATAFWRGFLAEAIAQ